MNEDKGKRAFHHQSRPRRRSYPFTCLTNFVKEGLIHDHILLTDLRKRAGQSRGMQITDMGCGRAADFNRFERALPGITYTGIGEDPAKSRRQSKAHADEPPHMCLYADMSINMLSQSPFRHHPRVTLLVGFHEVSTCLRFAPTVEACSTWTWLDRTSRCRAATYFGVSWGCRMRAVRQRSCSDFSVGHGTASRMAASF